MTNEDTNFPKTEITLLVDVEWPREGSEVEVEELREAMNDDRLKLILEVRYDALNAIAMNVDKVLSVRPVDE